MRKGGRERGRKERGDGDKGRHKERVGLLMVRGREGEREGEKERGRESKRGKGGIQCTEK